MNYYEAARVRKTGLLDLMADNLVSNPGIRSGIGRGISSKFKAKIKGITEKFDPLNIVKFLTFGSDIAPTLLGKATGRSREDIGYFTGRKEPKRNYEKISNNFWQKMNSGPNKSKEALEKIVSFMEKSREDELEYRQTQQIFQELNDKLRQDRHKEVIDVLLEATKAKVKAEKVMQRDSKRREAELKKREQAVAKKEEPKVSSKVFEDMIPAAKESATTVAGVATRAATRVAQGVVSVARGTAVAARVGAPLIAAGAGVSILGEAIAKGESAKGSYNAANMGTREEVDAKTGKKVGRIVGIKEKLNLEDMTIEEVMRRQSIKWGAPNEKEKLFAVGKYQVIPATLKDAVTKLGISTKDKFTGQIQEKIFAEYLIGMRRPAIMKYLTSVQDDPVLLHNAIKQLSLEWASIADPDIPGGKSSHYGSGNKASMTVDEAAEFLRKDRQRLQNQNKSTPLPAQSDVSKKIEDGSIDNAELKKLLRQQTVSTGVYINQNNQTVQQKTVTINPAKVPDVNPMLR